MLLFEIMQAIAILRVGIVEVSSRAVRSYFFKGGFCFAES